MNTLVELRDRFRTALASLDADAGRFAELVLPSQDAKFGDYQANCAMPLGKQLDQPPREIAQQLAHALELADMCEPPEIAGPGFINLRLKNDWLVKQLQSIAQLQAIAGDQAQLGIAPVGDPRTYVLDYSAPNVAKPMHVGHIRSTVIGDSLCRVLRFLGHKVISDNHIGDWGTQFGMIIYGYKHFVSEQALAAEPVAELSRLYKLVNQLIEYHDTVNNKMPELEQQIVGHAVQLEQMDDATIPDDPQEQKKVDKRLRQTETQLADVRKTLDGLRRKVLVVDEDPQLAKRAAEHAEIGAAVLAETAALHAGDP
ncbi:MAG: arginine--tRNA ligase, partial [Planctomycetes bacterium]|nr:arginine--tRNA ligase [Planctomycetota bacterium]